MERKRAAPRPGRFCASRPPPLLQCQMSFIEHLLSTDSEEPATVLTPTCPLQVGKSFPETLSLTKASRVPSGWAQLHSADLF